MRRGLTQALCLQCKRILNTSRIEDHYLICGYCDARYPLVAGKVPVLMANPIDELAATCVVYERYLHTEKHAIERFHTLATSKPERAAVLQALAEARQENMGNIYAMQQTLIPFLSFNHILAAEPATMHASYGMVQDYYLERDWSGNPDFEAEMYSRMEVIGQDIQMFVPDNESVLVLGAGTGRVAWELCPEFEQVYALDSTFSMPYSFYTLLEQDISYNVVQASNVLYAQDRVRKQIASLKNTGVAAHACQQYAEKITYFMADATQIPLPDHSQSAIVSVYFTDVLPLKTYLPEVIRVLKDGGLFIHFGPLVYHFSDESEMLTTDELLAIFEENGFQIVSERQQPEVSAFAEGTMSTTRFINWMFTARKKEPVACQTITIDTKLTLTEGLTYEEYGPVTPVGTASPQVFLLLPSGKKLKTSVLVRELLQRIDSDKTVLEVLNLFSAECVALDAVHRTAVIQTLQELLEQNVIRVIV